MRVWYSDFESRRTSESDRRYGEVLLGSDYVGLLSFSVRFDPGPFSPANSHRLSMIAIAEF